MPRLLLILAVVFAVAGCSGARKVADRPALPEAFPTHSLGQIQANLAAEADTLRAFSAKTSLALRTPEQSASLSATLRHRRSDSLYMSLSPGLGIEAARVLVTPDSFFVYDRLKKRLSYGSLAYAAGVLPAPLVGDDIFRSLLGLTVPEAAVAWRVEPDSQFYHLVDPEGLQRYVVDPARWRIVRYEAHNAAGALVESRTYDEFDRFGGILLPRSVVLDRPLDDTRARLYFREIRLNPDDLSFAFRVGDDAERVLLDAQPQMSND